MVCIERELAGGDKTVETKDGHYFLKRLEEEVTQLEKLAQNAEDELADCASEEGAGVLRAAAGKARLLVAQKLTQFRGLCLKNIKQSAEEDFPTTNEDLAGFWDMVMIQVREVSAQFDEVKALAQNNWQPLQNKTEAAAKVNNNKGKVAGGGGLLRKKAPPVAVNTARDEARRRMIAEKRRQMREAAANSVPLLSE